MIIITNIEILGEYVMLVFRIISIVQQDRLRIASKAI